MVGSWAKWWKKSENENPREVLPLQPAEKQVLKCFLVVVTSVSLSRDFFELESSDWLDSGRLSIANSQPPGPAMSAFDHGVFYAEFTLLEYSKMNSENHASSQSPNLA